MEIHFIKIKQKSEVFFICKIRAVDLQEHVNFSFRDPYYNYKSEKDSKEDSLYISKMNKNGININPKENSSQRKLRPDKVASIKNFLEENSTNFFPTSIILSLNIREDEEENDEIMTILENNEYGIININSKYKFNIIDGQHRLAGIFKANADIIKDFEIPVVLLIDVSVSNATKIFLDINANQTSINKSLVYDLYEEIDSVDVQDIRKIHTICQKFYRSEKSPLYKQIKMLGVGSGAISQAFFIDTVLEALKQINLLNYPIQDIYTELFNYFRAYQSNFQDDWPVILDKNREKYSDYTDDDFARKVLKENKSQLVKTTGFGAIMMAFPKIYIYKKEKGKKYIDLIKKMQGKINWNENYGTGNSAQRKIYKKILECFEE